MTGVIRTIEGQYAVIEMGTSKHKVIMPIQFLPRGAKEGHTLQIDITIDPKTPRRPRSKVTNIKEKLNKRK
ncbi:MAG: DUF3006 domain-containing protein [Firmicutes bacterium]|nr:DUF3006 domain-containing protein [Bacillota bacterium]